MEILELVFLLMLGFLCIVALPAILLEKFLILIRVCEADNSYNGPAFGVAFQRAIISIPLWILLYGLYCLLF